MSHDNGEDYYDNLTARMRLRIFELDFSLLMDYWRGLWCVPCIVSAVSSLRDGKLRQLLCTGNVG
jgi:hypothetical protein